LRGYLWRKTEGDQGDQGDHLFSIFALLSICFECGENRPVATSRMGRGGRLALLYDRVGKGARQAKIV
jgi:hypothetical protein